MSAPLAVAIVGCGWAGTRHAHALLRGGAAIRWLIDTDPARVVALRESLGGTAGAARTTSDYREALADVALDAVVICLPHDLHAPVAVAAAEAGTHVLCEKPLADTLDAADRMIAAAERAGTVLMVAENVRFDPLYETAHDLIRDGAIGRPALAQVTREAYLTRSFLEGRRWFLDRRAAAGGIMMSGGVHDVELLRMLIGEIGGVYAVRARQRFDEMEGDDTSVATLRFRDGAVGVLVESFVMKSLTTAAGPEVHTLRIDGDLGSLAVRADRAIELFSEQPNDRLLTGQLSSRLIRVPEEDCFAIEGAHFLDAVRTGAMPRTSGRSQRRPLEIVLAAYRSMATGLPVEV